MDVITRLDLLTRSKPLCVFMRGAPDRPTCERSGMLVGILQECDADFHAINVQQDPEIRAFLAKYSESGVIPQLFLNGEFLGDAQVVRELHDQGEFRLMIESAMSHYRLAG